MQNATQPQTTNNSNDRDAAIQIPNGGKTKLECIRAGAMAMAAAQRATPLPSRENPGYWMVQYDVAESGLTQLAFIVEALTSSDKYDREWGKKRVRELVKLGKASSAPRR